MRNLFIAAVGLALLGQAPIASAAPPSHACAAPLNALTDQWDTIGFAMPVKPAQAFVSGQHGYRTSGTDYEQMVRQIRLASRDCDAGKDRAALSRIEQVQELLSQAGG